MKLTTLFLLAVTSLLALRAYAEEREPAFWTQSPPGTMCVPAKPKPRKRRAAVPPKPAPTPVVIEKIVEKERIVEVPAKAADPRRNRVKLLGGMGPYWRGGLEPMGANKYSLSVPYYPTFGAGYERLVTQRISIGAAALSNLTFLLSVGYDF